MDSSRKHTLFFFAFLAFLTAAVVLTTIALRSRNDMITGKQGGEAHPPSSGPPPTSGNASTAGQNGLAVAGPSVENMRFIQKGFTEFTKQIDATLPCLIKITAPEDSRIMASEYGQIVSSVLTAIPSTKCRVEGPSNLDIDPDARHLALDGIVAGKVIFHASKTQKGLDNLFSQLSFWVPMEKSFDVPKSSPPNFIWLQFGTGVRWKS
jgi:hypothetical protein